MTRKKKIELADAPGQDSFLDVVTNLVGILIIIIMVIGTRATDAMVDAASVTKPVETPLHLKASRAAAEAVEQDIQNVDAKLRQQQVEIDYRRNERDKFLLLVTTIETGFAEQQQHLSREQQEQLAASSQLLAARQELGELIAARRSVEASKMPPQALEHRETPIAQTVFGQEVHFQLRGGRLTYVPWEEMVGALKAEAPGKVYKLKDASEVTEALGPIRGFRMEYTLRRGQQMSPAGRGTVAVSQTIELDRFILIPVDENLGEPLEQAYRENSELLAMLSRYEAKQTTVTVWVYPDSFGKFRDLKAKLYELGFLASARPMPAGHPIGGSPRGSRSAAE